jgi:hypothetical protein
MGPSLSFIYHISYGDANQMCTHVHIKQAGGSGNRWNTVDHKQGMRSVPSLFLCRNKYLYPLPAISWVCVHISSVCPSQVQAKDDRSPRLEHKPRAGGPQAGIQKQQS